MKKFAMAIAAIAFVVGTACVAHSWGDRWDTPKQGWGKSSGRW